MFILGWDIWFSRPYKIRACFKHKINSFASFLKTWTRISLLLVLWIANTRPRQQASVRTQHIPMSSKLLSYTQSLCRMWTLKPNVLMQQLPTGLCRDVGVLICAILDIKCFAIRKVHFSLSDSLCLGIELISMLKTKFWFIFYVENLIKNYWKYPQVFDAIKFPFPQKCGLNFLIFLVFLIDFNIFKIALSSEVFI